MYSNKVEDVKHNIILAKSNNNNKKIEEEKKEKIKLYSHSAMSRDYVKHFAPASRPLNQQKQRTQHCNDSISTKQGRKGGGNCQ